MQGGQLNTSHEDNTPHERFGPGRLRINRFTARFYDKRVERLFGNFSYTGRLRSLRLGSSIFSSSVSLYFAAEIILNGRIPVMVAEAVQLCGIIAIFLYTAREHRLLHQSAAATDEDAYKRAWNRASADTANRNMDVIAIYSCIWGWLTLITLRFLQDDWEEMPVAVVIFAWGVPVVSRAPFLPALLIHFTGILVYD